MVLGEWHLINERKYGAKIYLGWWITILVMWFHISCLMTSAMLCIRATLDQRWSASAMFWAKVSANHIAQPLKSGLNMTFRRWWFICVLKYGNLLHAVQKRSMADCQKQPRDMELDVAGGISYVFIKNMVSKGTVSEKSSPKLHIFPRLIFAQIPARWPMRGCMEISSWALWANLKDT